jgi:lysophospholipase L1-like esterase
MSRRLLVGGIAAIFVAGAALLAWLLFPKEARDAREAERGWVIVAFGDSLTAGYGAENGGYVAELSARLGNEIINAGRVGDTTGTALARLETDVLMRNPDAVIVFLGGNDILQGVRPATVGENLDQILRRISAREARIVLVEPSGGLFPANYSDLLSDNIHPNERGYKLIADRIEPALRDMLR